MKQKLAVALGEVVMAFRDHQAAGRSDLPGTLARIGFGRHKTVTLADRQLAPLQLRFDPELGSRSEGLELCLQRTNMNREYHNTYSRELQRDMEVLVFGTSGLPTVVFPTSMGRFFDYENHGMVAVVAQRIERGELQLFCVDSVDSESWYNKAVHPRERVQRHNHYERYLLHELLAWVRSCNQSPRVGVAGCSFGGYHAVNFSLRHPDLVSLCVSMGGAFDVHQFLDGYYDENCYFNCPPDYLANLNDEWYLSRYRQMRIVLATGEDDMCRVENERLSRLMDAKQIPHWLDLWGDHAGHDWPWWHSSPFFQSRRSCVTCGAELFRCAATV